MVSVDVKHHVYLLESPQRLGRDQREGSWGWALIAAHLNAGVILVVTV